ncbi:helix-turn-helix transcriptional regulator [Dongia deserti]|uniref:helix-turn-helix transcriptional regulator n=1 Tax=Dongia deserti TaxID=2268030 RepID=UPI002548838F|nr:helix-turn-helix transcriptional regulator [Dongia deserti]
MMEALPNAAEAVLADAIQTAGTAGFEAALSGFLRKSIACNNVVVIAFRRGAAPEILYEQADDPVVFRNLHRVYVAGAYLLDPYHDLHLNRIAPGAYRLVDIAPDQFQRSQYYLDYYRQTTLIDELTFVSYPDAGTTLNICLGRDASMLRTFGAQARAVAARITPIVVALANRHWHALRRDPARVPAPVSRPADAPPERLRRELSESHVIRLSQRQAQVALLILQGHSSVSIGLRLGVSPQTVKVFRRQLYARCGISSQAELFALLLPLLTTKAA